MLDQATDLRKLVSRAALGETAGDGPSPRLVVCVGGKGGVGATTVAVNLSLAMAEQATRVVLVDADLYRADIAVLCGLPERHNVGDVLTARRDIHEVLERGPAGIQVVPGLWAPGQNVRYTEAAHQRLLGQFAALGRHADAILLDVGGGSSDVTRSFWQSASDIVVVTTPDDVAVMDAYATIKAMRPQPPDEIPIHLVVNRESQATTAENVHSRVDQSCRRFLKQTIRYLGNVPADIAIPNSSEPVVVAQPSSPSALAFARLASRLTEPAREQRRAA